MRALRAAFWPMIAGVVIFGGWEAWVNVANIQGFLLPAPSDIWAATKVNGWTVAEAARATFRSAFIGLAIGSLVGVLVALITVRFRRLGEGLTPLAIVAASTPIVVLAPISNVWFGLTSMSAKIVVVAVVTFFPVFVNATRGLDAISPSDIELMHSYGASRLTVLMRVRIPSSIPMLFVGLKVAASLAMITTIISEYFGGSRRTLGVYITQQASVVRFDDAWVGIGAACLLAFTLYVLVVSFERVILLWLANRK